MFRRLEEEGVLFREEVDGGDDTDVGVLFDRFAGYLIADALLVRMSYAEVAVRLAEPSLWETLVGENSRDFGEDVAINLIGLVPRRFGGHHLWRFAPDEHRSWALAQELDLESELLDDGTVEELETLILKWTPPRYRRRHPFDRLWEVRTSPAHRLNAQFLDRVLCLLPLAERDRSWTEWVRHRAEDLVPDLNELIEFWTQEWNRDETDDLSALATAWLLSSTSEAVRDLATKALQRYGRPEPRRLFDLATRMLDVDDPYVVERVIGAAFGAASAHQMPDPGGPFEQALAAWLIELHDRFLDGGSSPTSHELLRSYVRATFELAGTLHPGAVPAGIDPCALTFAAVSPAPVMGDDDPHAEECAMTFGMDFENYVIGSAVEDRANYNFDHTEFRRARGEVMARVWDLGWRAALLGDVDRSIAEGGRRLGRERAERYGKKYGWIAYYELIGRLTEAGRNPDGWVGGRRNVTPDIDPSFPDEPPVALVSLPEWAPAASVDDEAWLHAGAVDVPAGLWSPDELHGVDGGWLLIEAFLEHKRDGRRVWGFFHTLLLEPADVNPALELIGGRQYLGSHFFSDVPTVRDVFAGELPWSPRFDLRLDEEDNDDYPRPALRRDWRDEGITVGQMAVELATGEGEASTALKRSYYVPSSGFAARFSLRQLPGTLDLVGLDGVRASVTFRTQEPWRGKLLFVRRDLVSAYAGDRRIVQVGWGEREVTVEWGAVPAWVHEAHRTHENMWHDIRVLGEP